MIEFYSFGEITIDGEKYTNDVIILPDRIRNNWWRKEGHSLHPEDIAEVVEAEPEVLVVGTGAYGGMKVPSETQEHLKSNGIELIAEKSESACETYNELADSRKVAAALHLTC